MHLHVSWLASFHAGTYAEMKNAGKRCDEHASGKENSWKETETGQEGKQVKEKPKRGHKRKAQPSKSGKPSVCSLYKCVRCTEMY